MSSNQNRSVENKAMVKAVVTALGAFPPSHKRVDVDFAGIFRIADGKVRELWIIWDNMAMLAQLGHLQGP